MGNSRTYSWEAILYSFYLLPYSCIFMRSHSILTLPPALFMHIHEKPFNTYFASRPPHAYSWGTLLYLLCLLPTSCIIHEKPFYTYFASYPFLLSNSCIFTVARCDVITHSYANSDITSSPIHMLMRYYVIPHSYANFYCIPRMPTLSLL